MGNPHFSDFLLVVSPILETKSISVSWYSDGFFFISTDSKLIQNKNVNKKKPRKQEDTLIHFFL